MLFDLALCIGVPFQHHFNVLLSGLQGVYERYRVSLLQQPGPKKFKLSKIELIYKLKKFKVPPFTISNWSTGGL